MNRIRPPHPENKVKLSSKKRKNIQDGSELYSGLSNLPQYSLHLRNRIYVFYHLKARLTQQMTETKAILIDVQKEKLAEAKQNAEGPREEAMEAEEPEEGITEAIMEKLKAAGDVSGIWPQN